VGNQTFVYGSSSWPNKGIRGFAVQAGGALAELAGSPYDAIGGYYNPLVPVGQNILAIKAGEFIINNGELVTHGVQPDGSLTIRHRQPHDVDGFYPHVGRGGTTSHIAQINQRVLLGYTFDANTGALSPAQGSPFPVDPNLAGGLLSIAVYDDLAFLYDARTPGGGTPIQAFRVNANGTLTALAPMKDIGEVVTASTFNRSGRCLVTASADRVRTFAVDPITGQLLADDRKRIAGANIVGVVVARVP
jgi:6-phosphogluconolactonase (cycloisomerase 2 family)